MLILIAILFVYFVFINETYQRKQTKLLEEIKQLMEKE